MNLLYKKIFPLSFLTLLLACVPPQNTPVTGTLAKSLTQGKIAFYSNRSGQNQVYQMNLDGGELKQVSQGQGPYYNPVWSPNGQSLVFSGLNHQAYELFLYSLSDQRSIAITDNSALDDFAAWSPDGQKLVFHSDRQASLDIFLYSLQQKSVSPLAKQSLPEQYPRWSPDGKHIAYLVRQDQNWHIYLLNVESGEAKRLTPEQNSDYYPRWSPDGKQIAFLSKVQEHWELFVMNQDGSQRRALAKNKNAQTPAWSRDGRFLAFVSKGRFSAGTEESAPEQDPVNELYTLSLDAPEQLKQVEAMPGLIQPIWGPENQSLIFQASQGNSEIFLLQLTDLKKINLTHDQASDSLGDLYVQPPR